MPQSTLATCRYLRLIGRSRFGREFKTVTDAVQDKSPTPATPVKPAMASMGFGKWLLLGGCAIALAGAVGFAVMRSIEPSGPQAAQTAAPANGDMAAIEAAVRTSPNDSAAWARLGEAKFDAQEYQQAADAYSRATELSPAVAGLWSALGEAIVMSAPRGGPPLPDDAMSAFRQAIKLDAKDARARYFLAVKRDVDGDHQGAINDWLALLADTPQGAPWEPDLRRTIEQVAARHNIDVSARLGAVRQRAIAPNELPVAARGIPGPSQEDMQRAAQLPQGQRDMMVQGMLDSLQAKLDADPRQPDGWIMMMRSRMTLGETAKAGEALRRAIAANPEQEQRLRAQAQMLGVPGA